MEQITNYVKPELIVVAIALYFVGMALKQAQAVKDKYIPLILGGISIAICAIYVFATCTCGTGQDIAMAIFTAITQGLLIAGNIVPRETPEPTVPLSTKLVKAGISIVG